MYIPRALFAFHAHTNKRWGTSPFYLTYGIKPILPHQTSTPISRVERAEAAEQRRKALQTLQTHRTDAAKRYRAALKQLADQRDDTSFAGPIIEGDLVMRKVQSRKTKLHPKWDGPFVVYEVTDNLSINDLRRVRTQQPDQRHASSQVGPRRGQTLSGTVLAGIRTAPSTRQRRTAGTGNGRGRRRHPQGHTRRTSHPIASRSSSP
jgi:hypothetical protein